MSRLAEALVANRSEIEQELARTEEELRVVQGREAELRELIERARITLGLEAAPQTQVGAPSQPAPGRLTLHQAMLQVLRSAGEGGLTATELASAVNQSGLYTKRDGSAVDPGQIYARTHNYSSLFERVDGRIRSRRPE